MKKALVCGISKYARADWRDLWGVETDLRIWRELLLHQFAVPEENIRVLVEERCTKAEILARIDWLCADSAAGDSLYFVFGGHGAQYASRSANGDLGRIMECVVPFDFSWEDPLSDEELGRAFGRGAYRGAAIFGFFDCCHSGGLAREVPDKRYLFVPEYPREVPIPNDILWRIEALKGMNETASSLRQSLENSGVFLFACGSEEKAWETWLNGDFRGIFSFAVEEIVRGGERNSAAIVEKAKAVTLQRGFRGAKVQTPVATRAELIA